MDPYVSPMLEIIGAPRSVNVGGKYVSPAILFSPALCESALFWKASSLSSMLHGEVILSSSLVADPKRVSGCRLAASSREIEITQNKIGLGLAASLLLLCEAGDAILRPAKKHKEFDYSPFIFDFRTAVSGKYSPEQVISPNDFRLETIFYDNIAKPTMSFDYVPPPALVKSVKK
jgi:hypothetical protein